MGDALKRKRGGGSAAPYVRNHNDINKINLKLLDLCSADKSLEGLEFCGFICGSGDGKPFVVGGSRAGFGQGWGLFLRGCR